MKFFFLTFALLCLFKFCIAQDPSCEVIDYNTHTSFNGSKVVTSTHIKLKINNGIGTDYAEIQIPFNVGDPVKDLQASIKDMFGNEIRSLKKKDQVISSPWSDASFHSDRRLLSFKMIHNRFPYYVEYSYKTTETEFFSIAYWTPKLFNDIPVRNATLETNTPIDCKLNIYTQNIDSAQTIILPEFVKKTWVVKDYSCSKEETLSPRKSDYEATVVVMPEEFEYGLKGNINSWKSFGEWQENLLSKLDKLTPEETIKVHQIADKLESDQDKIKALYHYLQDNTRYISVQLGIGGYRPYPASYVCSNKYGDCKALSNYMMAMLKEVGIKSYYTLIYGNRKPPRFNIEFPSPQFNHVMLCVP